jgi:predicted ATP-grasp superfamily ATP-dependent carboligase
MPPPSCLILDADLQCSLPVIESLRHRSFHVTVGSHKRINMGFFSRYPNRRVTYPAPKDFPERFFDRILDLTKLNHYDFILPTDDISSEILVARKDILENYTRLPLVAYPTFMKARDKSQTIKIAIQSDVPCPHTFFPDEEDITAIAHKAPYPVLVKPNISTGARGISLVTRKEALETTYANVRAVYGECHIQEYVPAGGPQYKADLFLDANQELKGAIVYSKLRYFPIHGGSSVVNRTVRQPQIIEYAYRLLKAIGWRGFADFDFITDPRDGTPKVMEINPRIPACFRITLAAGIDFPYMIAQFAMGEEIPNTDGYELDVYLRHLPLDILWFLRSPDRFRATPSFFKFFGRNLYDQIISFTDPGPILGFCLENLLVLFERESRKTRYSKGW